MLTVHHALAFLVIAVCLLAAVLAVVAYRTRGGGGALVAHAIALAQTLIVAQVAVGLLLLADHRRADKGVHYMLRQSRRARGGLALALRAPGSSAPAGVVRRGYPVGSRACPPRLYDGLK